jgi:FtsH-binding integral membrane protein
MTYPFIPIGLIAVFIVYMLYLLVIKKDMKKLKIALYPGLFFIIVWAVIYYFLLK